MDESTGKTFAQQQNQHVLSGIQIFVYIPIG